MTMTAKDAVARKANKRLDDGKPWSASCSIMELVIENCEDAWSDPGNNIDVATATGKVGTNCATLDVLAAFTTGNIGYEVLGSAVTVATTGYTHAAMWLKSEAAIADLSASLQFGITNDGAYTNVVLVDFPAVALAAATWTRVLVPLSTAQNALDSVDCIGINVKADLGAADNMIYVDDIRMVKFTNDADSLVELADSHTESGAATYKLEMPFSCGKIISVDGRVGTTVGGVPKATNIQVESKGHAGALYRLAASEMLENEDLIFDTLLVTPQADLGATESIDIRVLEMEVL